MKQQANFSVFIRRVGGFFAIVLVFIFVAKEFYPKYKAYAAILACVLGALFLVIEGFIKREKKISNK